MSDVFLIEVRGLKSNIYVERDIARTGWSDTIEDIRSGQVEDVVGVVYFNTEEGIARDASEDAALEILKRIDADHDDTPKGSLYDFLEEHCRDALYEHERARIRPSSRNRFPARYL